MTEKELVQRIGTKRREAAAAGVIHKRDLMREINRLEKELKTYRYYQRKAKDEKRKRLSA